MIPIKFWITLQILKYYLKKWNSEIDLMLSDGYGRNIPSTVIDLTKIPYEIVRKGAGDVPKNLLISL